MNKYILITCVISGLFYNAAVTQKDNQALTKVKDSIVARYNRNDFKGVYNIFHMPVWNKITPDHKTP